MAEVRVPVRALARVVAVGRVPTAVELGFLVAVRTPKIYTIFSNFFCKLIAKWAVFSAVVGF